MSFDSDYDQNQENQIYFTKDNTYPEETILDLWENCVQPSVTSIFFFLNKVLVCNLFFGTLVSIGKLPQPLFHTLSGCVGLYLIYNLESQMGKVVILIFFMNSYFLLHLGCAIQNRFDPIQKYNITKMRYWSNSNIVKYTLILIMVLCEYYLLDSMTWLEIRGVVMVFAMKLISLADDMDKGITQFPSFSRYFGYIFCGANILFGPWISFQEYIVLYHHPTKKSIWWIYGVLRAMFLAIIFLILSNCVSNFLISYFSNRWFIAYKEAFSFRTSHYFICYLSEAMMLAAGFKNYNIWYDKNNWRFVMTNPLKIEFPNALAVVVSNWNKPMHEFLKRYIYKSWLPLGKFYGILATFLASSFLHGFELKVSVVLISIGIFSYIQYHLRDYLSEAFNCCIRVHPCREKCRHKHKRTSVRCRITLLTCSTLTVLHLIFLGVLMDTSTQEVGIYRKWRDLHFISLYIMGIKCLFIIP